MAPTANPNEPPNAATGDIGSILKLPCQHVFHGPCIRGWILHRGMAASCPLCKRAIGPPPPSQPPPGLLGSPATVVPEADADAPPPPPPVGAVAMALPGGMPGADGAGPSGGEFTGVAPSEPAPIERELTLDSISDGTVSPLTSILRNCHAALKPGGSAVFWDYFCDAGWGVTSSVPTPMWDRLLELLGEEDGEAHLIG